MRVGVHLLKRIPMDFEPSDSVAFVRSKIQRLFLEQLRKQGEDDLDEVDVTLLFQGEVLEDSQTLAEANVTANATLFVLSQSLAEIHGKHSGVFSVRKAFEDLAQSGLSGADAEAQALKNAPPFSLFCNIQELGELGAGWVLFFHFVRFLGILCVVLFALQLPSYFVFRSFPEEALESWRNHSHTKRDHPISWDYITAGNTGPHGSDACWCRARQGSAMMCENTAWVFDSILIHTYPQTEIVKGEKNLQIARDCENQPGGTLDYA
ncbi:unnamed protein product [Cladocopium goreaui]|uniref:E3 ubiquitin-protein ligase HERC4 n=1 Tax=Cladocopium goreaui TaxID=2562237 RepID=A0A9P1G9I4_9DINO|nr:unnamed protein product [Cladocopium goreaui]